VPVLRTLTTALLLALLVAVAVAMVARWSAWAAGATVGAAAPTGPAPVIADSTLVTADSTAADTTAGGALGAEEAAADSAAVAADAADDSAAAIGGEVVTGPAPGAGAAGPRRSASGPDWKAMLPRNWQEVVEAPERWIVVAAFAGTFLAALFTAWIAVRGSVPAVEETGPVRRRSDAVQLLAVLQRDGRLVDFLREEIESFSDAQIGAAVRAVHAGCRQALEEHLVIEPVNGADEGTQVTVESGFDPSAIRLTGNVSGDPPFTGALRHRGWRAKEVQLPTDARGQDPEIIAPAEVEIG
jgi:hypothetical protein